MATTAVASYPKNVRRLLYMFGAVTQIELKGFLDMNSVDSDTRKREIKVAWANATDHFEEIRRTQSGEAEAIETKLLDPEADVRLKAVAVDPVFAETFSNYPYTFEEVEIARLVACQRSVHADFVEQIKSDVKQTEPDLLGFCLIPNQATTAVNVGRTGPNAFTATSENPGLTFLGAYEQPYVPKLLQSKIPGGKPVYVIALLLGYSGTTVNAYRVGKRLILNNGFHRLYALGSLGVTHVPMVVQEIKRPKQELPPVIAEVPRDYLIEDHRPPLLKDFFDEALTCQVLQRSFTKALQVMWGTNDSFVPRP